MTLKKNKKTILSGLIFLILPAAKPFHIQRASSERREETKTSQDQEAAMRPDVCAGCAGGGARSCPICVCMNVCVMHCHSTQSYISVIHIDSMSV